MQDGSKHALYRAAWHGDRPYDAKELIRLEKACAAIQQHARQLGLNRRYELLDAGCGVGPLRAFLPAERFRIVGLEIGESAAAAARRNYDDCLVADAEGPWPVAPGGFDGVHAGAVLEHVLDWHAPLNGANRALRQGGLLVVTTPNLRYWKDVRRLIRGKQPHWLTAMEHVHGYTPAMLRTLVELHGFQTLSLQADRVNLPLLPDWAWVCRRFAGIGSVLILAAIRVRVARVLDQARQAEFPHHRPLPLRSIEAPPEQETA